METQKLSHNPNISSNTNDKANGAAHDNDDTPYMTLMKAYWLE